MGVRVSNFTAQALLTPTEFRRFVTDELAFHEEPFRRKMRLINLTAQILFVEAQPPQSLEDEIAFEHEVASIVFIGDYSPTFDNLGLTDTVDLFGLNSVHDPILFVDVANCDLHQTQASHHIVFEDSAEVYNGVPWFGPILLQQMPLDSRVNRAFPLSVTQAITFSDISFRRQTATSSITFTQVATCGIGPTNVHQTIVFTQFADPGQSVYRRNVLDQNVLQQSFTYFVNDSCSTKTYNRYDGEGSGGGIPAQRMHAASTFTLETLTGPKTILVLRNPETDNRDRLAFNRINRETRGGEINIYSDPNWPKVNTLLFTILALKRNKIDSLQQFLQDTLGREIKITDWTNTVWHGVVTTPGETATEDGKNAWTLSFEFEGIAYPGQAPDVPLQFQQSVGIQGIFKRSGSTSLGFVSVASGHIIAAIDASASSVMSLDHEALAITVILPALAHGSVEGVGNLSGVGFKSPLGHGIVEGVGNLVGIGHKEPVGHGSVEGVGSLSGVGHVDRGGFGSVQGVGELNGRGRSAPTGHGSIEGVGQLDAEGSAPAPTTPQIDIISSSGTWTQPAGAVSHKVFAIGGGGGGAGGRQNTAGNSRFGGGGGGGGGLSYGAFLAAGVSSTETITIGAGGAGGASTTAGVVTSNPGTAGGTTSFGSHFNATGGGAGLRGNSFSDDTNAVGGVGNLLNGGLGGAPSSNTGISTPPNVSLWAPTGGGAGGTVTVGNTAVAPSVGGASEGLTLTGYVDELPDFPTVLGGIADTIGNTVTTDSGVPLGGTGGGGGTANAAGNGTTGGAGANYGAGGGGGGAALSNSGAGGAGAGGAVIIITYFS